MQHRPVGTVTFLFTDMEGSSRAWDSYPSETRAALQRHDEIVAREVEAHNGAIILERGEGDSVFAVFTRGSDAVAAAFELQRAFQKEPWPTHVPVRVRTAIHTGEAGADYRGPHVNRTARIRAIGHGEQILVSGVTAGIVRGTPPENAALIDLGQHRVRDVAETEHVFQLRHPELREEFPPLKSLSNFRQNLPVQLTSFIGRERERETVRSLINDHRVVTLIGSGGCGKTRLAIQVGADLLEQFPDGVRFVDLASLSDPSLVLDGIATAVEVKLEQGDAKDDALVRRLEGTKTLIILDNCEHLVRACAEAVSVLLRTGEHVRVCLLQAANRLVCRAKVRGVCRRSRCLMERKVWKRLARARRSSSLSIEQPQHGKDLRSAQEMPKRSSISVARSKACRLQSSWARRV